MSETEATICTVKHCYRPSDGWFVCGTCGKEVEQLLAETVSVLDDLDVAITKQARFTSGGGPRSNERPLPVNLKAADASARLVNSLTTTARMIAEDNGWMMRRGDPRSVSTWLLHRISAIRLHVAGGEMVDELARLTAAAIRTMTPPPERWFAGICSMDNDGRICDADLYASAENGNITCQKCASIHDVGTRRAILLKSAEDVLATASEAARAIVVWSDYARGENKLVNRIGKWAERGRIERRGWLNVGGKDRPTYRVGDILDLLAVDEQMVSA